MKITPSYTTGAGGPDFERRVATALICSSLINVTIPPLNQPFKRIWLQAGHLKCKIEDIVLDTDESSRGSRCFCSVKTTVKPLASDNEFKETISRAWLDWCNPEVFEQKSDYFALITSISRSPRIVDFLRLTEIARSSSDHKDFHNRLSIKRYNRESIRQTVNEVSAVIKKETSHQISKVDLHNFLKIFTVLSFDLDTEASQDKQRAIGSLSLVTEERDREMAENCWNAIFGMVSEGTARAKSIGLKELNEISEKYLIPQSFPKLTKNWLKRIREHSRINKMSISSTVGGAHLSRNDLHEHLNDLLSANRFNLVTGSPGSGKSSLALKCAEKIYRPENIFYFNSDEFSHRHIHSALESAGLLDLSPSEWADAIPYEGKLIVIDSLERVLQSTNSSNALDQLFHLISSDPRWNVLATCRDYFIPHVSTKWLQDWKLLEVPLLSDVELEQLKNSNIIPQSWFHIPEVSDALRNLKWLDIALRALEASSNNQNPDNWKSIAEWRNCIWNQLIGTESYPEAQELLIQMSLLRIESGDPWFRSEGDTLKHSKFLFDQGVLLREGSDSNRYKTEHDIIEDWTLIVYVRRVFKQHSSYPSVFFETLGSHLLVRRAFRQFFSELLEGLEQQKGVSFIDRVFIDPQSVQIWRTEILIGILGANTSQEIIVNQNHVFHLDHAKLFKELHHTLRTAFFHVSTKDIQTHVPIGPGWCSIFSFVISLGESFILENIKNVFNSLEDWHVAVNKNNFTPQGLTEAATITKIIWKIAISNETRFEDLVEDNRYKNTFSDYKPLYWVVAHLAKGLGSTFFQRLLQSAIKEENDQSTYHDRSLRETRQLLKFLTTDYKGWVLARSFPRIMAKLCLYTYGITSRAQRKRLENRHYIQEHPYSIESLSSNDSSAIRGPFLQLLQSSNKLGIALILRLVHEETLTWLDKVKNGTTYSEAYELKITINETSISQMGDQAWWRAYRGHSPCHPLTESALMALEKWLIEEVGATNPERLETILSSLILSSHNLAITSVAVSVAQIYWWECTKITAAILESDFIILSSLDRHRLMNDRTSIGSSIWEDQSDIYFKERKMMSQMEHRQNDLEHLFLKSQLTEKGKAVTRIIDSHLNSIQKQPQSEETMLAKTILHRIDSRNLVAKEIEDDPNHVLLEAKAPPKDIQQFQEETAGASIQNMAHIELQMWAVGILEPMPSSKPDLELWRDMLEKANQLAESSLNSEEAFMHGDTPTLVAAVCLIHKWSEFDDKQKTWSIDLCLAALTRNAEVTSHSQQHFLKQWKAESAAARAFATLLSIEDPTCDKRKSDILSALSIGLTLPEKSVQFAAASAIGSSENEQLKTTSAALMILSARIIRNTELSFRGPLSQNSKYENWQDTLSAMHQEILSETVNLRNQFIQQDSLDTRFLSLYYPRGHEEEERLCAVIAAISSGESAIHRKLSARIFKWTLIQTIAGESRSLNSRKYGMDKWRNQYGSIRHSYVTIGEVKRQLAKHILNLSSSEAQKFLADNFFKYQIEYLGSQAGSLLKDLCLQLDMTGKTEVFWEIWEQHIFAAIAIWDDLSTSKSKKATSALYSIVESIFLNDMHFKKNQEWEAINSHLQNFSNAFKCFNLIGLSPFIRFLYTVGARLLPTELSNLARAIALGRKKIGLHFLSGNIQQMLLSLMKDNIASQQCQKEDLENWKPVRDILDFLIDLGHPEAYLMREQIARY